MKHDQPAGDRIVISGLHLMGRHGVSEEERSLPQPIDVDLEVELDLAPAGTSDDLSRTVDYAQLAERCREIVEERSFALLEAIAEAIATDLLREPAIQCAVVRVRKLAVPIDLDLEWIGVEIRRRRVRPTAS